MYKTRLVFLKKHALRRFGQRGPGGGEGGRIHNGMYASRTMLTVQKQWRQGGWPLDAPRGLMLGRGIHQAI